MNDFSMSDPTSNFTSGEQQGIQPGDILSDYSIHELLGRGGMGEVYRAENRVTGRVVALKVISEMASRGPDFVERFKLEARVMSELDHPGIVRVHHAGESRGRFYLTMDLVEGGTLDDRGQKSEVRSQEKNGSDETWVREIAVQLCEALSYAHGRGIVHRDLKPGNIMLDKQGKVKITDFGLAKAVGDEFVSQLVKRSISLSMGKSIGDLPTELGSTKRAAYEGTSTGAILGTYEYMSPEQQVGGEITKQSDLYSLGVILYWLLTGRKPKGRAKAVSFYGVNPGWDPIVDKLLEEEFMERYVRAEDVFSDLTSLKFGRGKGKKNKAQKTKKPHPSPANKKSGWKVLLWLLLLCGMGAGGYLLSRGYFPLGNSSVNPIQPTLTPEPEFVSVSTPQPTATPQPRPASTATPRPRPTTPPRPASTATPKPRPAPTPRPIPTATPKPVVPLAHGSLHIINPHRAEVYAWVGDRPVQLIKPGVRTIFDKLPVGKHRVIIQSPSGEVTREVSVKRDQKSELEVPAGITNSRGGENLLEGYRKLGDKWTGKGEVVTWLPPDSSERYTIRILGKSQVLKPSSKITWSEVPVGIMEIHIESSSFSRPLVRRVFVANQHSLDVNIHEIVNQYRK